MATATYPPKRVNNVANSIFNPSDYTVEGNDLKYVKLSGSSMTGALSCRGFTSTTGTNTLGGIISLNTNVALPTAYNASPNTAVPTISQLGGTNKQVATAAVYTLSTISNIKTISLNQGIYLLIYRVVLTNTSAATVYLNTFSISVSTSNNALDDEYRCSNGAIQTLWAGSGQTSLEGCRYYSLSTGSSATLYLNYFATASASLNVAGFIQAVRVG